MPGEIALPPYLLPTGKKAGWFRRAGLDDMKKRKFLTLVGLKTASVV
jgi:hypothetical protein